MSCFKFNFFLELGFGSFDFYSGQQILTRADQNSIVVQKRTFLPDILTKIRQVGHKKYFGNNDKILRKK